MEALLIGESPLDNEIANVRAQSMPPMNTRMGSIITNKSHQLKHFDIAAPSSPTHYSPRANSNNKSLASSHPAACHRHHSINSKAQSKTPPPPQQQTSTAPSQA
jgi:hypothetical protein